MTGSVKFIDEIKFCWEIKNYAPYLKRSGFINSPDIPLFNKKWTIQLCNQCPETVAILFFEDRNLIEDDECFRVRIYRTDGSLFLDENTIINYDRIENSHGIEIDKTEKDLKDALNSDGSLSVFVTYPSLIRRQDLGVRRELNLRSSSVPNQGASSQTVSIEALNTLSKDFKELFISARQADIKIKVGDQEFQAHKSVLSARSPVLDSMFSQQMLENISGVVNIKDCDADAFKSFLMFLYSGQLDQIQSSDIVGLYDIADKYDLPELKEECVKKLILELSVDSICDALQLAALHEEKGLMETATEFFLKNAEQVLESSKWESFHNDHLKTKLFKLYIKKGKKN